MEFDPDAYLAGSSPSGFDPDAYLGAQPATAPQPAAAPVASGGMLQSATDRLRYINDAITLGGYDKLVGGARSLIGNVPYQQAVQEEVAKTKAARESLSPAEQIGYSLAGSVPLVLAGGPAGLAATGARIASLPRAAGFFSQAAAPVTTAGRIGAGVAEGAALGAIESTLRDTNVGEGAVLGGILGGGGAAAISPLLSRLTTQRTSVTPESLKSAANTAYDFARQQDVLVKPQSFRQFEDSARKIAQDFSMDPMLQPRANRAFERIGDLAGRPVSLNELDNLRKIIGASGESAVASEREIARRLTNRLDDYVSSIDPAKNVLLGKGEAQASIDAFKEGRKLWSQQAKASRIDELIQRAETSAPNYSASGLENALRIQFRQVAQSPKQMRRFNKDEQAAIRSVAKGDAITNAMRMAGKFAPRGIVSGLGLIGVGSVNPLLAMAAAGVGEVGRRGATARTSRAAESARNLMLSGQPITQRPMTAAEQALYQASVLAPQGLLGE